MRVGFGMAWAMWFECDFVAKIEWARFPRQVLCSWDSFIDKNFIYVSKNSESNCVPALIDK